MLTRDDATWTYRHDTAGEMPSVTTINTAMGLVDTRWFTPEAARDGREVHAVCAAIDNDEDAWIRPDLAGFRDAYRDFLRVMQPDWIFVEHMVCDPVLGYAGTLDRAGTVLGVRFVVDIKTGVVPATVGLQTAAYRRCLPEPYTWGRASLQLTRDGKYFWRVLSLGVDDERVFLAALAVFKWKQANRIA